MDPKAFKPFVPAESSLKEFTFKAVFLGVIMAVVLGAANAYLGMRAGLTVAATFPAAVVAMAAGSRSGYRSPFDGERRLISLITARPLSATSASRNPRVGGQAVARSIIWFSERLSVSARSR